MPSVGLGTWQQRDPEVIDRVVRQALEMGYRLIDTASAYRNEKSIGETLSSILLSPGGSLKREDIWITSKLAPKQQGYEPAMSAVLQSLKDLRTDYIDLYLIHWPGVSGKVPESPEHKSYRRESWKALEALYKQGKIRAIGVSNYTQRHLEEMHEYAEIYPMVNQCELHPLCPQPELLQYCSRNGVAFTAYASLGEGFIIRDQSMLSELHEIRAKRTDLSSAQILLMWGLQHGASVIPKASSMAHLQENISTLQATPLSDSEMARLDSVSSLRWKHICWNPDSIE
ncbi:hypothetical protein LPJ73_006306 [Coemansia sp. RSA 2703]|nr:hypothetical protein LPJ73_006306 [Coemansia sp. RSA 2703]KAJ2382391.1 hypothetical protein GGI05_005670 [Coemansia sp. RSA 2603]